MGMMVGVHLFRERCCDALHLKDSALSRSPPPIGCSGDSAVYFWQAVCRDGIGDRLQWSYGPYSI
eukprot:3714888-Pleurochrysis_carterae.AAC.1